jgi:hypothetical protein
MSENVEKSGADSERSDVVVAERHFNALCRAINVDSDTKLAAVSVSSCFLYEIYIGFRRRECVSTLLLVRDAIFFLSCAAKWRAKPKRRVVPVERVANRSMHASLVDIVGDPSKITGQRERNCGYRACLRGVAARARSVLLWLFKMRAQTVRLTLTHARHCLNVDIDE